MQESRTGYEEGDGRCTDDVNVFHLIKRTDNRDWVPGIVPDAVPDWTGPWKSTGERNCNQSGDRIYIYAVPDSLHV